MARCNGHTYVRTYVCNPVSTSTCMYTTMHYYFSLHHYLIHRQFRIHPGWSEQQVSLHVDCIVRSAQHVFVCVCVCVVLILLKNEGSFVIAGSAPFYHDVMMFWP
jgi:hypothetical protein